MLPVISGQMLSAQSGAFDILGCPGMSWAVLVSAWMMCCISMYGSTCRGYQTGTIPSIDLRDPKFGSVNSFPAFPRCFPIFLVVRGTATSGPQSQTLGPSVSISSSNKHVHSVTNSNHRTNQTKLEELWNQNTICVTSLGSVLLLLFWNCFLLLPFLQDNGTNGRQQACAGSKVFACSQVSHGQHIYKQVADIGNILLFYFMDNIISGFKVYPQYLHPAILFLYPVLHGCLCFCSMIVWWFLKIGVPRVPPNHPIVNKMSYSPLQRGPLLLSPQAFQRSLDHFGGTPIFRNHHLYGFLGSFVICGHGDSRFIGDPWR